MTCYPPTAETQSRIATQAVRSTPGWHGLAAGIVFGAILLAGCDFLPGIPTDLGGESWFQAIGTIPPIPDSPLEFSSGDLIAPVFSLPQIPDGTIQPMIGPAPDWWYLVPVHRAAYAAGTIGRDYHYLVALPPDELLSYYEGAMKRGGWEEIMDTITTGSYSMMLYDRGDTDARIYIAPRDGGTLVSIVIE